MKKQIVLRPYIFNKCTEFCLQLCQKQGWFEGKTFSDITAEDRKQVYWANNWDFVIASYLFWSEDFG